MYNYSVIIPHSNSLDTLERAVRSVPLRKDIQIIVIDNSPSKINPTIVHDMNNNAIVLYSDSLKGAGHARNVGLNTSEGMFLLFLDADDFFNEGAFNIFDSYIDKEYDIVYFNVNSVFSDTLKPSNRSIQTNKLIDQYLTSGDEQVLRCHYGTPWCKLIRHSLVRDNRIFFDETPVSNDLMFSVKTGYFAKTICCDVSQCYCVTIRRGSLVRTISRTNSRVRFEVACKKNQFLKSIGLSCYQERLTSRFIKSIQFGLCEPIEYAKLARKYKVNLLWGIGALFMSFLRKERIHDDGKTYNTKR